MNDGERGFFTMDMFFALLILVATSTVLLNFAQGAQPTVERTIRFQRKEMALEKLATGINTVYSNGPSFRIENLTIDFPNNMNGREYYIKNIQDDRIIKIDGSESIVTSHIIPKNVYIEDNIVIDDDIDIFLDIYWEDENIVVEKN